MTTYRKLHRDGNGVFVKSGFSHCAAPIGYFQSPPSGELNNVARTIYQLTERPPLELLP
jgi:hypothetical protein